MPRHILNLFLIWFKFRSQLFLLHIYFKEIWEVMKEVIHGCVRGLGEKIFDCKLAMHANCFDETRKSMIQNLFSRSNGVRNRSDVSSLDLFKGYCHYSIKDLCIQTDDAWWKMKKFFHGKDIGIYPDGCIVCLKFFSTVCVLHAKKGNDCMLCSHSYDLFYSHNFEIFIKSLIDACFMLNSFF